MHRLPLSLALLSAAILGLQLAAMQRFSFVQWHHFAFMVISVALLGFGLSGTLLSMYRDRFLRRSEALLPFLMLLCGAAIGGLGWALDAPGIRFDSYRVFVERSQLVSLALTYAVLLVPFLLGALAIGIIFVREPARIGVLYFWNMAGSASGAVVPLVLMDMLPPDRMLPLLALLPLISALLIAPSPRRRAVSGWAVLIGAGCFCSLALAPTPIPSEYKDLSRALALPGARIEMERPARQGILHVVRAPALRYAPGISLRYSGPVPGGAALYVNGDWAGPLAAAADTAHILDYTTLAAAYVPKPPGRVLVIHGGTGVLASHALSRGARSVTVVEPHKGIVSLMRRELAAGSPLLLPHVRVENSQARSFLRADTSRYDLIVLPTLDAFGGTSGIHAMQEQYALTREAFSGMFRRLAPGGILSVSSWLDEPPRNPLRLLATLADVLEAETGGDPRLRLAAVRSWGTITYLLFESPVSDDHARSLRSFCDSMAFDPAILPGITPAERTRHNGVSDTTFFACVDRILSGDRERLYAGYDFDIRPSTDDRPYFSQFLRSGSLARVAHSFGLTAFPFLELGYVLVLVTFLQVLVAALVLVLLPLLRGRIRRPGVLWTIAYFGGIGLGFIFVEIVFIQKSILILGDPVYAAAAVMCGLLLGAGCGSYLSGRRPRPGRGVLAARGATAAIAIGLASWVLVPLIADAAVASSGAGFALFVCGMAVVGFPMGYLFPIGLRHLAGWNEGLVPWAWGVNGSVSVVGAVLAALLAVEAGFAVVLAVAVGAYLVSAAASLWLIDR